MPRIIVTTDPHSSDAAHVLLDEHVRSLHISSGHGAAQLIERLGWALLDAESAEDGARTSSAA